MVIKISLGKCGACSKGKLRSGQLFSLVPSVSIAPLFEGGRIGAYTPLYRFCIDLLSGSKYAGLSRNTIAEWIYSLFSVSLRL